MGEQTLNCSQLAQIMQHNGFIFLLTVKPAQRESNDADIMFESLQFLPIVFNDGPICNRTI